MCAFICIVTIVRAALIGNAFFEHMNLHFFDQEHVVATALWSQHS